MYCISVWMRLALTRAGVFSIVRCRLRTRVYGGYTQMSYGSEDAHVKGDILMQRFITLLSLILCAAVASLVIVPGQVHAADNVIKFGIATPLSGPAAAWGIPHK